MFFVIQFAAISLLILYYLNRKFSYWTDHGVQGPKPFFNPLGNLWNLLRDGQVKAEQKWFDRFGKIYGIYFGTRPILTISDHELIRQVLVKDFGKLVNRDTNRIDHDIWSTNLFASEGEQWKRIRAIASPSFSSGKLRGMHSVMQQCVHQLAEHFDHVIQSQDGQFNAKEVLTGFTIDVIAATSFATDTNANKDHAGGLKNRFLDAGVKILDINPLRILSFFIMPKKFNRFIGNSFGLNENAFNFYANLSREILKQRKLEQQNQIKTKRNDLVQLLMDAFVYEDELLKGGYEKLTASMENDKSEDKNIRIKNETKKYLTENEIIAQCILFFAAGFETTATTLSNAIYNLAVNQQVQSELYEQLKAALLDLDDTNSDQYYETVLTKIPYLDAVIKETLRITPPLARLQRQVGVEDYQLDGIPIEKDIVIEISVYAVHHNPEYYPEPSHFKPSRFMPENKHQLVPYTYLPFGDGPRNCIGMRFAYQEIKLCLAQIALNYQFFPTAQTKIPLEYTKLSPVLTTKNIPLRVVKR